VNQNLADFGSAVGTQQPPKQWESEASSSW